MSFDCIVTQVHVPHYDVQGGLPHVDKLKLVDFGLEHLRAFNPNAYIILCGHGFKPAKSGLCDHVYWNDVHEPLNEHGYVIGMPAQFKYVSAGLEHARSKGFTEVLKTRGDCVVGIPNVTKHCHDIMTVEQKELLITQQTGEGRMGDCFMYGKIDVMCRLWHATNRVWDACGLINTAHNFRAMHNDWGDWKKLLQRTCAFRDVHALKFTCLRWNYYNLNSLNDAAKKYLLDPKSDVTPYHWGRANGWHRFDYDGNMQSSAAYFWSAKDFYEG